MGDFIADFYSRPQLQSGAGLPVFMGTRRQLGGSFLSSLARFAMPILKFLGRKAFGVAKNVATDVIDRGIPLRESVPKRTKQGIKRAFQGRGAAVNINKRMKPISPDIYTNQQ